MNLGVKTGSILAKPFPKGYIIRQTLTLVTLFLFGYGAGDSKPGTENTGDHKFRHR
jgi:hypothetical protein